MGIRVPTRVGNPEGPLRLEAQDVSNPTVRPALHSPSNHPPPTTWPLVHQRPPHFDPTPDPNPYTTPLLRLTYAHTHSTACPPIHIHHMH